MYEYEDGRISQQLSYKTASGSYWYSEGDIILTGEMPLDKLEMVFPEIRQNGAKSTNVAIIALAILGFVEANRTHRFGWKIIRINSFGNGKGQVTLRAVLLFESGVAMLERTEVLGNSGLNTKFTYAHLGKGMLFIANILYGVANIVVALLPLAIGGGPLMAVEKLIARKSIKIMLQKIVTDTTKAFAKAAMHTIGQVYIELEKENLKTTAGITPAELKIIFLRAAEKGAEVFLVELWLNTRLKKFLAAFYPVEQELTESIKRRFVAEIGTAFFAAFAQPFFEIFVQMPGAVIDKTEGIARLRAKVNGFPAELATGSVERLWNAVLSYHQTTSGGSASE